MSVKSLTHSCTALSMAFIIAMTANSTAHANAIPTQTSEMHSSDQYTRLKAENFVEMMESLPEDATSEEAAPIIFPNNREAQVEFVSNFQKLDDDNTDTNFRALPASLAPFGVALAKCAVGALGGAAVN